MLLGWSLSLPLLVISHVVVTLPFIVSMTSARLAGLDPTYEEAALSLGASQVQKFADPRLAQILFEEWAFLQGRSWIASRIKKPFTAFMKAGAVSVILSVADPLARRTLRLPQNTPKPLKSGQRLRAISKWIAAGGSAASTLLSPYLGFAASLATNIFFLVDPQTEYYQSQIDERV